MDYASLTVDHDVGYASNKVLFFVSKYGRTKLCVLLVSYWVYIHGILVMRLLVFVFVFVSGDIL